MVFRDNYAVVEKTVVTALARYVPRRQCFVHVCDSERAKCVSVYQNADATGSKADLRLDGRCGVLPQTSV